MKDFLAVSLGGVAANLDLIHTRIIRPLFSYPMWHSSSGTETHLVLEMLAYFLGARVFFSGFKNAPRPNFQDGMLLLGSTIFFALLGSKLLHIAEHFHFLAAQSGVAPWLAGKSVLGGFLGGTFGSELAKKLTGWRTPTGDAWVPALALGLIVGRLGCQLSGTWDQTYGTPTALPWAWNYGDGLGRHPTGLYEILLVALAYGVSRLAFLQKFQGASFAMFLLLYCLIRFGLEWLKPPFGAAASGSMPVSLYAALTAIQWAAVLGAVWYGLLLHKRLRGVSRL